MSGRAILAEKNKDVDDINFVIQSWTVGILHSFECTECITNKDEAIKYLTQLLNSLSVPGLPPYNLTKNRLDIPHDSKWKWTKTMQWNAFGDKKTDDQCDSYNDIQRKI